MKIFERKDKKQIRVGSEAEAIKAAIHFREKYNYKFAAPVQVLVTSPGGKNVLTCYGVDYFRPAYGKGWLYLLIHYDVLKKVYSRKHYYVRQDIDWYITGYSTTTSLEEQYAQFNPFGHSVSMTSWDREEYGPLDSDQYGHPKPGGHYPRCRLRVRAVIE